MSVVTIEPVTRIEGHARITIKKDDADKILGAHLEVMELRGFEKLLQGMEIDKMPLVTARICGVCPVAHHIASSKALDACYQTHPPPAGQAYRHILLLGHLVHSHALSLFVLSGPDIFLGIDVPAEQRNIVHLASVKPDLTKKALRLRTIGQLVVETLGGRGIHPVTSVAGGVTRSMTHDEKKKIINWIQEGKILVKELLATVRQALRALEKKCPEYKLQVYNAAHVDAGGNWDIYGDHLTVKDANGADIVDFTAQQYADYFEEKTFEDSYMKNVSLKLNNSLEKFWVGPLARLNVSNSLGSEWADKEREILFTHFGQPVSSPIALHEARLIEIIAALQKLKMLILDPGLGQGVWRHEIKNKPGAGIGSVEAPRGVLVHHYETDEDGKVSGVNLIVATQNNYLAIDDALAQAAANYLASASAPDGQILNGVEHALRMFDPCLACATHRIGHMPIEISVYKQDTLVRRIRS
ncbi:MAG: Ni/Fe hydrogenase subunit alpha [Candidatus Aminicenantes bacterium]|nr:MAG: Ni/Fe hydrogenase subunit alpha [Candidatus Aminicenantes bacterium]